MQIYPVREGYLRKIHVERRGKFLEPPLWRGKFACPRNRYFSQITLTNRTYLFNSAEYITASKTVAGKQILMQINLKYILFFKLRIKTCSYIYNNNKVNRQFVYSDVIRDVTNYLRK